MQKQFFLSLAVTGLALLCVGEANADEGLKAQPEMGWLVDDKGCKVANPFPQPDATVRWSGACVDGWAEGAGTLQWFRKGKPSLTYSGTAVHGLADGEGAGVWPNGDRYEGQYAQGVRTGHGSIRLADGSRYEGDFKEGKFQGEGVFTWADRHAFEGHFEQGRPDGRGTYISSEGRRVNARAKQGFIYAVHSSVVPDAAAPSTLAESIPVLGSAPAGQELSLAMRRCSKILPPRLPSVDWLGEASYFAWVSVIEDRIVSVDVRPMHGTEDPELDEQFIAALTKGLQRYECKGSFYFGQEFVIHIK